MRIILSLLLGVVSALITSSACPVFSDEPPKKAIVVLVFDETCKAWCKKVRPVMQELKDSYGERVDFAELDATQAVLADTKKRAKDLGVLKYFADAADYVPEVMIFNSHRSLVKELGGPKTKEEYSTNIDKAISQSK